MASRSGTANGANRDVERAYESGRRARCGAGLVCDTVRARTACVLTDRDGVRATDRDDERHGAGPDGERTVGTAFDMRCGYDRRVRTVRFGTTCERDGAGAAGVAAENYDVNRHGYGSMILWWRTTTTAPPRIILVPIASDGLSVRRRVVYELVYRSEPTDGASVEMELHYSYAQWRSFVR